jgi:hypothetical protein
MRGLDPRIPILGHRARISEMAGTKPGNDEHELRALQRFTIPSAEIGGGHVGFLQE